MIRLLSIFAALCLCMVVSPNLASAQEPNGHAPTRATFSLDWSTVGEHSNQLRVTSRDGVVTFQTEGQDPYFRFPLPKLVESSRDWIMQWDYFCPDGIRGLQWRIGPGIHRPGAIELPPLPSSEGWTTYSLNLTELAAESIRAGGEIPVRIDLGNVSGVQLQIRDVRIRQISDAELELRDQAANQVLEKQRLAERIAAYHSQNWPAEIDSVTWDGAVLRLTGRINSQSSLNSAFVVVRRPESVAADRPDSQELIETWPITIDPTQQRFEVALSPASQSPWLEAGVRFQLFVPSDRDHAPVPVSAATYRRIPWKAHPQSMASTETAKGLTCITPRLTTAQLRELGLGHASVNVILSGLVSATAVPGWEQTMINGRTWWRNSARLNQLDEHVRTATDAGAVVAGILLIPTARREPHSIAHPESTDAGTYAMPNLNDAAAIAQYTAALHVLGQRYGGDHPESGRVDHWIAHNEVDYGWQWTNMGQQPFEIFMDHYVRSMRLIDAVTRKYNPEARVFISLTHRWNTTDNQHWKTYAPKAMIQWLIQESKLEGDFPWGVAYHPYPQSLWKADVWNDTKVSDDFNTTLITVKNLQVLDRFMHLPESRTADGFVRPVICSEQGFHADENDQDQLEIQAAALLYTWQKLRECPSIIAFDYHRPSDHPHEGGLRLGLRGLPSKADPLGAAKPAWDVYSSIGTDREAEMIRRYQRFWESD